MRTTSEVLALTHMDEKYIGEWLVLRVTDVSEWNMPLRAEILSRAQDRHSADEDLRTILRESRQVDDNFMIYQAGSIMARTGEELRQVLAQAAQTLSDEELDHLTLRFRG